MTKQTAVGSYDPDEPEPVEPASVLDHEEAERLQASRSLERQADAPVFDTGRMLDALQSGALAAMDDPEDISRAITDRILQATTADEILAPQGLISARDLLDVPIALTGVRWQASTYEEGAPVYAILEAKVLQSGDRVSVSCGARSVLAQAFQLQRRGFLPADVVIRQKGEPTRSGFRPLWLEAAPAGF